MTDQATLRIRAVGEGKLPFVDAAGINQRGRFAGRDAAGKPIVEDVPNTIYYRRALRVGSLEECADQPIAAEAAEPAALTAEAGDLAADLAAGGSTLGPHESTVKLDPSTKSDDTVAAARAAKRTGNR
jgi:hypothetical protein